MVKLTLHNVQHKIVISQTYSTLQRLQRLVLLEYDQVFK